MNVFFQKLKLTSEFLEWQDSLDYALTGNSDDDLSDFDLTQINNIVLADEEEDKAYFVRISASKDNYILDYDGSELPCDDDITDDMRPSASKDNPMKDYDNPVLACEDFSPDADDYSQISSTPSYFEYPVTDETLMKFMTSYVVKLSINSFFIPLSRRIMRKIIPPRFKETLASLASHLIQLQPFLSYLYDFALPNQSQAHLTFRPSIF